MQPFIHYLETTRPCCVPTVFTTVKDDDEKKKNVPHKRHATTDSTPGAVTKKDSLNGDGDAQLLRSRQG